MKRIYDLGYEQLQEEFLNLGMKKFTAQQVFQWLYGKNQQDIHEWTNISKTNREILLKNFDTSLDPVEQVTEDSEGTGKYLFKLHDGQYIESVLMKEKGHYTFCISSQVGCALGCRFCATATMGFRRNLSPGEILSQILSLKKPLPPDEESGNAYKGKLNLVFMGMGEPLLNYDNLKHALTVICEENGLAISPRNITVSTAGILQPLRQLETDFSKLKISFSLNAPGQELRQELMPISRKEKLEDILSYFRETSTRRKHRITFEYVLIKGINDSLEDAQKIAGLLRGISCKINLIPYNQNEHVDYQSPEPGAVEAFGDFLHTKGYTVIVRWSRGQGIQSACGQLAARSPSGDNVKNNGKGKPKRKKRNQSNQTEESEKSNKGEKAEKGKSIHRQGDSLL